MKMKKALVIFLILVFVFTYVLGIVGVLSHKYNISYQGFAADSEGNIYIGFNSGYIKKFNDKKLLGTLSAQTDRGYDFTIIENDTLYITCGDRAYFTDLDGNILENITDNIQPFYKFRYDKSVFIANDGTKYKKETNFGRTEIIKYHGDEKITVYEMPLKDYCIKLILIIDTIILFGCIIVVIKKSNRLVLKKQSRDSTKTLKKSG